MSEGLESAESLEEGTIFVIIVGPNAVGKGTVIEQLLQDRSLKATKLVRTTSRKQGNSETDREDYLFISHEQFEEQIALGAFIE